MYRLLPWEEEMAVKYANDAYKKFAWFKDGRSQVKRLDDAFIGILGEFAFIEMLNKKRTKVLDWPAERGDIGAPYDIEIELDGYRYTIDVKCTQKSEYISSPSDCNLALGVRQLEKKIVNTDKAAKIFVQMFCDPDPTVEQWWFVGACHRDQIIRSHRENSWDKIFRGVRVIEREKLDRTSQLLEYFEPETLNELSDIDLDTIS